MKLPDFVVSECYYYNTTLKLNIKKSNIELAGKGVFSYEKLIKKGTVIGYYQGNLKKRDGSCVGDYSFSLNKCWYIDARKYPRCVIAMINDSHNSGLKNNCKFVLEVTDEKGKARKPKDYKICLIAKRDIKFGEELYADYGDDYWNCTARIYC